MGQLELSSNYPILFSGVSDATGYYARQLSIHNCFSRCIGIQATQNLLVGLNIVDINVLHFNSN